MTELATSPRTSLLVENCSMPFCKGCGHTNVIRRLDEALVTLDLRPENICLITDIGCIGLADGLFASPHTVHTTHGRSTAFATGIELADGILADSKLKSIVLIGDGGAMIGLLHLVNAALLNVDVTVILCNNFLFGMTGGQHSAFSPLEFLTPTTPKGNLVPPLDLCRIMLDSHASFVARKISTDADLAETLTKAIERPGFSLVEIVELCPEHAVVKNKLSGNELAGIITAHGEQLGILSNGSPRDEFASRYRERFPRHQESDLFNTTGKVTLRYTSTLKEKIGVIVAGSAGERVQSAARVLCEAAINSGLHCTQKNDNPVTQGSGFSLSEVVLSPHEIHYTGIESPSAVIVVSSEGLHQLQQQRDLSTLSPSSTLILDASLQAPETPARVFLQPFRKEHGAKKAALKAIEFYARLSGVVPSEAFEKSLVP